MASPTPQVPNSIPTKRLSQSITAASTTFTLSDIKGWDGVNLTAASFSTVGYGALRDAQGTLLEIFSFDPSTIASSAISFTTRGLKFTGDLTTAVSANKLAWTKGSYVDLGANPPQLFQWLKEYIDAAAIAGGVPSTTAVLGISKMSIAPISAASPIAVGDNDPRLPQNTYAVDSVGTDSYAVTLTTPPAAYATGQTYLFKAGTVNTGAATLNVNGLGAKTIKDRLGNDLSDGDIASGQVVLVIYDGTNMRMVGREVGKFGGTGADGALSITSGTTTITLSSAKLLIKNYTSISITGTGVLGFSGPSTNGCIIILKSQGNVTITSSTNPAIDLRNIGAVASTDGLGINCPSPSGIYAAPPSASGATFSSSDFSADGYYDKHYRNSVAARLSATLAIRGAVFCGGGGSPSTGPTAGSTGGLGAGGLLIQCGGALNITSTINASGAAGSAAGGAGGAGVTASGGRGGSSNTSSLLPAVGGIAANVNSAGGGGGGGCVIILYNSLTADSGTYTVTGGAAGATGSGAAATAGADGYSLVAKNTELP